MTPWKKQYLIQIFGEGTGVWEVLNGREHSREESDSGGGLAEVEGTRKVVLG